MAENTTRPEKIHLLAVAANASIVALELVGSVMGFSNGLGLTNFKWYTVQSNVFALASSVAFLVSYLKHGGKIGYIAGMMRYIASCCLAVTFLTVIFVLAPMAAKTGEAAEVLWKGPQKFHHIICPLLTAVSFVFLEQGMSIDRRRIAAACMPTLAYAVVFIILNLLRVTDGPYPFLRVYKQPWFMSVIWFLIMSGVALGSAVLIGWLRERMGRKT